MKKIFLTFMISLSTMSSMSIYAGTENCPFGSVHCAYMSGLSNNLNDGRYIKINHHNVGEVTICFNGTSTVSISYFGAGSYLGKHTDDYSICSDSSGKNCEQISVDNFVIEKINDGYSAQPKYFNLDLSSLKDKYPACDSLANHSVKL